MNNIQCVTYTSNSKIMVAPSLKCGSTTIIQYLGYPYIGKFDKRSARKDLFEEGLWKEYNVKDLTEDILKQYPIRIAIVRDPVDRLFSAYKDRIQLRNKGDLRDTLDTFSKFIYNIDYAREDENIKIHTDTQCSQIGSNPSIYTKVINSNNIDDVLLPIISKVSRYSDIPLAMRKVTVRKTQEKPVFENKKKELKMIKEMYKEDYEVWGKYFC